MPTHKLDAVCPYCGVVIAHHDAVPGQPHTAPFEGAYAMCVYCLGLSVFVNGPLGLALRKVTVAEYERACTDPRFAGLATRARQVREREGM
jgi:hypothetical protein